MSKQNPFLNKTRIVIFYLFWQVFKHTFDVVEDYVCYAMMAIGAVALSVK